jgi:hypothetical protein
MQDTCLRADCARCAALCCVALAFDTSEQFALDKPAGRPCPHLCTGGGCSIHRDREALGFKGCVDYSCFGAGQRVTQELFDGRSWQDDPSLLVPMIDAFRRMRLVHELLLLLEQAARLPLSTPDRRTCKMLVSKLTPEGGWTRETLETFENGPAPEKIRHFLRSLDRYVRSDGSRQSASCALPT